MHPDKKTINDARAKKMAEQISTPEGRMILEAHMWHPFPMGDSVRRTGETELEWAKRVMKNFSDKVTEGKWIWRG